LACVPLSAGLGFGYKAADNDLQLEDSSKLLINILSRVSTRNYLHVDTAKTKLYFRLTLE
jgi:hypothetical protein